MVFFLCISIAARSTFKFIIIIKKLKKNLILVCPYLVCSCQVTWTPDTDRGRVRGLQQSTSEKLTVTEMRRRGITSLTLHYSKANHRDIQ